VFTFTPDFFFHMILFRCSSTKDIVATNVGEDGRMLSDDDYDDVVGGGLR
jgi:hypothetical protein